MDFNRNWLRVKAHRGRLTKQDMQGIAEILFCDQEVWLEEKLRLKEDEALAMELLGYLGKSGSLQAVGILLKQLDAREEILQVAAAEALKCCPPILVLEPLAQIMLLQNPGAVKAGEVLLSFGRQGEDQLWSLWFENNATMGLKVQILQLLAEVLETRAESLAFLAFLSEEDEMILAALKTAERLDARALWGNVAVCLKHPGYLLRGRAARLLGRWEEERALAFLVAMGADPDSWADEERQKAIEIIERKVRNGDSSRDSDGEI